MRAGLKIGIRYFVMSLLIAAFGEIHAQELLIGLSENPLYPVKTINVITRTIQYLELPFVDDFSKTGQIIPDAKLWDKSRSVFVNNSYAINPPTKGVATFDALDGNGKIYANASSSTFAADTLMSMPLNLNYTVGDSVYLSFFVQPRGYGDMPEADDIFCLEFYAPLDDEWTPVWNASVVSNRQMDMQNRLLGTTSVVKSDSLWAEFFRVDIKIDNQKYLKNGFRFRFLNYASISVNSSFPGRSTNVDHWHLDYVYLDKNRTLNNKNIPDIALCKEQRRVTTDYVSIPAAHLESAGQYLLENPMNLELTYTNLGIGTKSVARNFRLRTIAGSGRTVSYSAGAENIADGRTVNLKYTVPKYEFSTTDDFAEFEITSWIDTDNDPSPFRTALRNNDTTRVIYSFADHYAYDDGSAENGYGLFGSGAANGKAAVKFSTYRTDSLRGIYLYFNRTLNDANRKHKFVVAVWNDAGGIPGEIIHRDDGGRPEFKDSLNVYVAYRFSKPVYLQKNETFYIGWLQTDEGFLNIGFDRNNNSREKTFFNLGQSWEPSAFEGSLMIRPIFCRADNFPSDSVALGRGEENYDRVEGSVRAYPNPARNLVYLEEKSDNSPLISPKVEIYALSGELVTVFENVSGSIDISTLRSGVYLMRVWGKDKRTRETKRMVVSK